MVLGPMVLSPSNFSGNAFRDYREEHQRLNTVDPESKTHLITRPSWKQVSSSTMLPSKNETANRQEKPKFGTYSNSMVIIFN